jgi:hypothetical protein
MQLRDCPTYATSISFMSNSVAIYESNKWILKLSNIKEFEAPEMLIRYKNASSHNLSLQ